VGLREGTTAWDVPHRQVVFAIPKMPPIFFNFKRRLLGDLSLAALQALKLYFETVTGEPLISGVIDVWRPGCGWSFPRNRPDR